MKKNINILPDWKRISKIQKWKEGDFNIFLEKYLENKKSIYKELKAIKSRDRNFENTVLALEKCDYDFDDTIYQIGVLEITHKDKKYRDLASQFSKNLSEKLVDIEFDKNLYKALLDYKNENFKKEKKNLDEKYGIGSPKLFEDALKSYKRMGFDLKEKDQKKLKENIKKLSNFSIDFSKNINEYQDYILCSEEELEGLPENFVNSLKKENGKYKISLEYPEFGPFIQFANSRSKRKELADKNYKKGGKDNLKILAEIVSLREKNAKLLGYKNHVDFKTENRMAKSEKSARDFVESLIKKLEKKSHKELKDLETFAKENLENYKGVKNLEYYDISYVSTKMKEKKYSYDAAKLKEYFELNHVLSIMFSLFGELLGFSVREIDQKEMKEKEIVLADKLVRLFELKDTNTRKIISYLILDLFPREGKYGHACSTEFINSQKKKEARVVPVNEIICNFGKPNKNTPSLLSLGEVETIFHEFGHALHYMLTDCTHYSQAGYATVWDFVETPSQLLENFIFEKKYFKKLTRHYQTKKPLDDRMIERIIEGKNFMEGYSNLRQLINSIFDLDLHSGKIKAKDSAKYYNSLLKKYFDFNLEKDSIFPAGFGHMMGYDAGYYSYMWALVYATDFYFVFKENINDKNKLKELGERYRKEILEVGGSREEMESVKKFLKRNPSKKAFLEKILGK